MRDSGFWAFGLLGSRLWGCEGFWGSRIFVSVGGSGLGFSGFRV